MSDVKITGMEELTKTFQQLPERLGRNAMRRALRKGANVVRDAARKNANRIDDPATATSIARNIAVSSGGSRREKRAGGPMMRVGVRGGARFKKGDNGQPGGNTTYWRFVEFGTQQAEAQPFLRPAGEENVSAVLAAVSADAPKQIARELDRMKIK